jgi:hypothetical protein
MNENILAVNIPNIVSITLMAMLGFAAVHLLTSFVAGRKTAADEEG